MVLVGDEPYYGPLGFKRIPRGQISMPRPVDLDRILAVEIEPGAVAQLTGEVCHADRAKIAGAQPVASLSVCQCVARPSSSATFGL